MPAGVTWGVYLRYMSAALLSMLAGAQVVHVYYRPLDDIDDYVKALEKRLEYDKSNRSNTLSSENIKTEDGKSNLK